MLCFDLLRRKTNSKATVKFFPGETNQWDPIETPKMKSPKKRIPNYKETEQSSREEWLVLQIRWNKIGCFGNKMKLNPCPILCSITNFVWILDRNVKSGILRLLENTGKFCYKNEIIFDIITPKFTIKRIDCQARDGER